MNAAMTAQSDPARERFELFLEWLAKSSEEKDRNSALSKIMQRLNKYFVRKGCAEPEELAGQTLERVVGTAFQKYPNPEALFFGVARNVWHESLRKPKTEPLPSDDTLPVLEQETEEKERKALCLEECLAQLPASERELVTRYYQGEGREAVRTRRALMSEQGGENTLRVRAHRIRLKLRTCIRACMDRKPGSEPK